MQNAVSGRESLLDVAERIAVHFEALGLSRTAAGVIGRLAVSGRDLTATELAASLGVAKSSMSVALATLHRYGLVTRHPSGSRGDVHRLAPEAFERAFSSKVAELEAFPAIAERGLELADDPVVRERLARIRDYYRFMLREFPILLERWEREREGGARIGS
jgi:Predicted transcriptional regulators